MGNTYLRGRMLPGWVGVSVSCLLACSDAANTQISEPTPRAAGTASGTGGTLAGDASAGNNATSGAGSIASMPHPAGSAAPVPTAGTSGAVAADSCAAPAYTPLYAASVVAPRIEQRADGVIITRGAGRVRGRHELEGSYSQFGERYFENRSYAFTVEDTVANGGSTITFIYEPAAPVSAHGAVTNFRHWKIYGDGNVFHSNVSMKADSPQRLTYVVDRNAREQRAMRSGDVLEFEFGIFISGNNGADPDPIEGRTAYYTDTFRYRVGSGGLTSENADTSGKLGPSVDDRLAGDTTIPWIYAEPEQYFSQLALNMQPENVQAFLRGRRLFHTDFDNGAHSEDGNPVFSEQAGKLGPMFSAHSCVNCHERDGRGAPPAPGSALESMVVKLYAPAKLGTQLQQQEGSAALERYEERTVMVGAGSTPITLRKPVFGFGNLDSAQLSTSIRIARQFPGVGLLEAIDEHDIAARADAQDCNGDGISGRVQIVTDPADAALQRIGRFGWKAEKVSVEHQIADALEADMGVTTPLLPEADGGSELDAKALHDLVTYTSLLGLPARRDSQLAQVQAGARLFNDIGCVRCHAADAKTGDTHPFAELRNQTIHPYTDLLLHDMGEDLADGSGRADASEWRTPPLWGLGMIGTVSTEVALLHDGRARTPLEAVLWHGGEALFARSAVMSLTQPDREALLAFLNSL